MRFRKAPERAHALPHSYRTPVLPGEAPQSVARLLEAVRRGRVLQSYTLVRVAKSGGVTVVVMVKCSKPSHGCARVYAIGTTPQGTEYARALCSTCFSRWERGQLRANLRVVRISLFGYR